MSTASQAGRLAGKVALITGGAGNIGEVITRRYLAEGATVAITGRNLEKLRAYRERLVAEEGAAPERVLAVRMDGSQIEEVRAGIAQIVAQLGRIDVLVNNAGTAGPRRRLPDVPLTPQDLQHPDSESLVESVGNLVGITWNLTRAAAPHMPPGSCVINISTIFSRTDYYGRIPYVVPKAALNALSAGLARELGAHGVRVNTIYPGPIESERIRTVFKAMDALKGQAEGSTAESFFGIMRLARPDADGRLEKRFPTPADVANTAVFLGSDEAAAFAGHTFEVTHGMDVPQESRTTFVSRPGLRAVDATGSTILICAGDQAEDALDLADMLRACRATVAIGFRDPAACERARALLHERRPASADMYGRRASAPPPLLLLLDPLAPAQAEEALAHVRDTLGGPHHALILPARGPDYATEATENTRAGLPATAIHATGAAPARTTSEPAVSSAADSPPAVAESLLGADDAAVERFLRAEIGGAVALASLLSRFWAGHGVPGGHRALFVSNLSDGRGDRYADILRAALEQLCRVWRHESELDAARPGGPPATIWSNQLIRYTNREPAGRAFAAAWVARLVGSAKRIDEINLYLPDRLEGGIGTHTSGFGWAESLFGLHMGKVALVTGGSAGIGGEIGRLLALSGAQVVLAARRADELERRRAAIVAEVRAASYPDAESRVRVIDGCDVADPESWQRMVAFALSCFGRVDYLINNAGIAGAEEMVVDMPLDAWRHTLTANLLSNYALIRLVAPQMKQAGGHILNVSSYFGGEKYVAIPYPNRADYAVSKAGQRALAEALARFLGPQVQINAVAPGPVEGERLQGSGDRPGLFARRARLILENKRLSELHEAIIRAHRQLGAPVSDMLAHLLPNSVARLAADQAAPEALRDCAAAIQRRCDPQAAAHAYLMNTSIARKLLARLQGGGYLPARQPERALELISTPDPEPFFTPAQVEREAAKVRDGVLGMLYLKRMPTEFDVALATVFHLADRNITGETFHPSGGLKLERTVTEGELFGKPGPQRLEKLAGATVFLIGEHLTQHLAALSEAFLREHGAARVALISETPCGARELLAALPADAASGRLVALTAGDDIEGALARACATYGRPAAVVSTPFRPLPPRALATEDADWAAVLSAGEFAELVEHNITHHFRVARRVSLIDGANLTLVTPTTSARSTAEEFALANFVKTTLHALTATLGAESERVVHHVPVNQVDLTRRARAEEPQNEAEEREELVRFVNAVLLTSAPLPTPEESRYRSRIYRGNAITV